MKLSRRETSPRVQSKASRTRTERAARHCLAWASVCPPCELGSQHHDSDIGIKRRLTRAGGAASLAGLRNLERIKVFGALIRQRAFGCLENEELDNIDA